MEKKQQNGLVLVRRCVMSTLCSNNFNSLLGRNTHRLIMVGFVYFVCGLCAWVKANTDNVKKQRCDKEYQWLDIGLQLHIF